MILTFAKRVPNVAEVKQKAVEAFACPQWYRKCRARSVTIGCWKYDETKNPGPLRRANLVERNAAFPCCWEDQKEVEVRNGMQVIVSTDWNSFGRRPDPVVFACGEMGKIKKFLSFRTSQGIESSVTFRSCRKNIQNMVFESLQSIFVLQQKKYYLEKSVKLRLMSRFCTTYI
ncbi:unnamed protein product [Notodromas monacha]|uniref:Uncharacterized protein n=1 Tax=Notodromas monacha TaxID=399045 RepID=A0A7R9GDV7_9CRUS|nr:unnamed protein product [Notodromas monacha]CAG0917271.1 unnamed protein product [Notodromas monacha]